MYLLAVERRYIIHVLVRSVQFLYNTPCYKTDLYIHGHVEAPKFFMMELYSEIIGK